MRSRLAKKPSVADSIVPTNFAVGCRRPTPGMGYLEALCEDNVEVISDSISEITQTGIKTADGVVHEFDVIVCATGFDVSWRPYYPTIGRERRDLAKEWKDIPSTYLSITVPHFPNYFSECAAFTSARPKLTFKSSTAPSDLTAMALSCRLLSNSLNTS